MAEEKNMEKVDNEVNKEAEKMAETKSENESPELEGDIVENETPAEEVCGKEEETEEVKEEVQENTEETKGKKKKRKAWKVILTVLLSLVGFIVLLVVILQIVLSPAMLTKIVNNVADDYIDGEVNFGKVSVSMFRHFPNLSVKLDSVCIAYPTTRYARYETGSPMLLRGKGETMDTLAYFNNFTAAVNVASLLGGTINVPVIALDGPKIYAKSYAPNVANWNIFKTGSENGEEEESEEEDGLEDAVADTIADIIEDTVDDMVAENEEGSTIEIPDVTIGRIRLFNKPVIVFCSKPDTLYATLGLRNMQFQGKLTTKDLYRNKLGFKIDSLYIAGRMQEDTLALGMEKLAIKQQKGVFNLDILANTNISTSSVGRMRLPISISSEFALPKDTIPTVSVRFLEANFAGIPLKADAELKYYKDKFYVTANASIDKCKVKDVIDNFGKNFWPDITDFRTDAVLTLAASVDGWLKLDGSQIPKVSLSLDIPDTPISNKKLKLDSRIGLAVWAKGGGSSGVDVGIDDLHFTGNTIQMSFNGSATDLLGKDPDFKVDAEVAVALDSLSEVIAKQFGMNVDGNFSAKAKGGIKMSQMNLNRFAEADLVGYIKADQLIILSEQDSLDVHFDSLSFLVGTYENQRDSTIDLGTRLMTVGVKLDSVRLRYKDELYARGSGLVVSAWNDAGILDPQDSSSYYPFSGTVKVGSFFLTDGGGTNRINLSGSDNRFTIQRSAKDADIPVLSLSSDNSSFSAKLAHNRLAMGDFNLAITATGNGLKQSKMAKSFVDSLAKKHPEIPRDSLFNFAKREAGTEQLPDWLTEESFRESDFDFKLDETFAKYYKEWDFDGNLGLDRAILVTPALPLRNTLTKVNMTIDNDTFVLKNLTVKSGKSDLSAKGRITGLRNGLLNNGTISAKVDISSENLNLNEMLTAYALGQEIAAKLDSLSGKEDDYDDDNYMDLVAIDTISGNSISETALLVIPSNLNAELTLDAANVVFSALEMESMHGDINMRERCLQLINTGAMSNMGNLTVEAFYSTKTKEDISAGFNLSIDDVTAEKIVELLPQIDTLMPMLTSFRGNLSCMIAATTQIDSLMNIVLPSLDGVLRIQGKNLALVESEDLYKILKILRFKDVTNIEIDDMSVEALISDNKVEIFPFVLSAGKYTLALSGVQNLDQSFSYHASIIKSPLVIRFGVNFTGADFDNMKFRIGKAKYKDANVEVFSEVIDETRLSLSDAINNVFSKGVDATIKESMEHKLIEERKKALNYVNPAEMDIEDLDDDESDLLDSEEES